MNFQEYSDQFLPLIELTLRQAVFDRLNEPRYHELRSMMAYHLGWEGESSGPRPVEIGAMACQRLLRWN